MVSNRVSLEETLNLLRPVARGLGWQVDEEEEDPRLAELPFGVRTLVLSIATSDATLAPDAWTLLQQARKENRQAARRQPGPRGAGSSRGS